MILPLSAALAAALAFGIASILQQVGARQPTVRKRIGPGLLTDLVRQPLFLGGVVLDAGGFALTFLALRRLPLFAVESAVASAVAVTAVLAGRWVGDRLTTAERSAVAAVVVGLCLVAGSALPEGPPTLGPGPRLLLLAGVPGLAALGMVLSARLGGRWAAPLLGGLAGVGFAAFGVVSRVLPPSGVLTDPLTWAAAAYVVLGLVLYGAALQRGSVTAVAAAATAVEALLPTVVGFALADGARAGQAPLAAAGFLLTLGATLVLIRSKSAPVPEPEPAQLPVRVPVPVPAPRSS
jgi:drug/metabolite transporter (DMT)-like permease